MLLEPSPCLFEQVRIWPLHTIGSVGEAGPAFSGRASCQLAPQKARLSEPKSRLSEWEESREKAQRDSAKVHCFLTKILGTFSFPFALFQSLPGAGARILNCWKNGAAYKVEVCQIPTQTIPYNS